jgi:hypothetical protein
MMITNGQGAAARRGGCRTRCGPGSSSREEEPVSSTETPGDSEVADFLRRLRGFRGTLSGVNKALLDSLVAAGLGRTTQPLPDDPILSMWAAYAAGPPGMECWGGEAGAALARSWHATAWGRAYAVRYG